MTTNQNPYPVPDYDEFGVPTSTQEMIPKPATEPPPTDYAKRKEWWQYQLQQNQTTELNISPTFNSREATQNMVKDQPSLFQKVWNVVTWGPSFMAPKSNDMIKEEYLKATEEQLNTAQRAEFMYNFYDMVPLLMLSESVDVYSYDDYAKLIGENPAFLSQADKDEINEAISAGSSGERQLPEWMAISPEEEMAAKEFLTQTDEIPPLSLQRLTVNSIVNSLPVTAAPQLPQGYTIEDMTRIVSLMNLDQATINEAIDIDTVVAVYREAAKEREQMIADVLQGVKEWELPSQSFKDKLLMGISSPMQVGMKIMQPYLHHVSYPMAGTVSRMVGDWLNIYQVDEGYRSARSAGEDPWHAAGTAWEKLETEWYWKLPMEIVTDPITYIPGVGLRYPAKALEKVGATRFSAALLKLNEGLYTIMDIPFDAIKYYQTNRMAKTFSQVVRQQSDIFAVKLNAAIGFSSGKPLHLFTVDDIAETLEMATKAFNATPQIMGNPLVELGYMLSRHQDLTANEVSLLSRSFGGITKVDDMVVAEVNDLLTEFISKQIPMDDLIKRMSATLEMDLTESGRAKLAKDLGVYTKRRSIDTEAAIKLGRNATYRPEIKVLDYLVSKNRKIIESKAAGAGAAGKKLQGTMLGLVKLTDRVESWRFRMLVDRYWIKPLAEANLGSISYPIWNILEGFTVSIIEGVTPGFVRQSAFNTLTLGLVVDPGLALRGISEPSGMLGSAGSKKAGAWSLLPGGKMTSWLGRNWIAMSDFYGSAIRRNFFAKKMERYLIESTLNKANGDIFTALRWLAKDAPQIEKNSLGISSKELEQEAFRRLISSVESLQELHTLVSNSSLMRGQALKILRKADMLSPRARAIGEELINSGKALKTTESVDDFIKKVSEAAHRDLQYKADDILESYSHVATTIEESAKGRILGENEIYGVFTEYEVMADVASYIPHRMMSQTMNEAEILAELGEFGKIDALWGKARTDMLNTMTGIAESMTRVKSVLDENLHWLSETHIDQINKILAKGESINLIRQSTLTKDASMLDTFFSKKKSLRTAEDYKALRIERAELWDQYRQSVSIPTASDFVLRHQLARAYKGELKHMRYFRNTKIDASNRGLSVQDIAEVFGVNVDGITSGIMNVMSLHNKYYFVQLVKQMAEVYPERFIGFTEEKIGTVYDNIIMQAGMKPGTDIMEGKLIQQIEGVRQSMLNLKMSGGLAKKDEDALHTWIDNMIEGRNKIIGEPIPEHDIGFAETVLPKPTEEEKLQAFYEHLDKTTTWDKDSMDEFLATKLSVGNKTWNSGREYLESLLFKDGIAKKRDYGKIADMKRELAELAQKVKLDDGNLEDAIDRWFRMSHLEDLEDICRAALGDEEYRAAIHRILKREYPSGYIRIYRGTGYSGEPGRHMGREFTNVTSDRTVAQDFQARGTVNTNTWIDEYGNGMAPELDNVLIKVEDVLSIASVSESEMLIPTSLLKERLEHPIKPPSGGKPTISPKEWQAARQEAADKAGKDYYKSFADYTNEGITAAAMKMIYPYWTYHTYRWFYLARTALRHPGTATTWGKYNNYAENGYVPTWVPDIEMNPFTGSFLGTTFSLTRFDFATYYENLGPAGEMLDYSQRWGFYPNAAIMGLVALTPYLSGRPTELSEIAPPIARTSINLFVASNLPVVSDSAKWLKDHIFHENFHEYYTATILSNMQVESGGKLLIDPDTGEPMSGVDIWFKIKRGEPLTPEMQKAWDDAYRKAALIGVLRTQFPQFRLRTEEYKDAYAKVTAIIEEQLGMSEEFQQELWRNHMRPTDVVGGLPLELRTALDEMWEWKIMMGRGTILMPPEVQDVKIHVDEYWKIVRARQKERLDSQDITDNRFLGTSGQLMSGRDWRIEYSTNWNTYSTGIDELKKSTRFSDIEYLLSPEGQMALAKRLGFNAAPRYPLDEAIDLYFSIELEKGIDPLTGEEDWDYLTFWLKREAVRQALTDSQRAEFDEYINQYRTPMEEAFKKVYSDYIRGYHSVSRVILNTFEPEEQELIKEYHQAGTTLSRKEQIEEYTRGDGLKLISQYSKAVSQAHENMRVASPLLDYYLYVFGYTTKPKTAEATAMINAWEKDRASILDVV